MTYMIKILCTCGQELGEKPGGSEPGLVSHSLCETCARKIRKEIEKYAKNKGSKK